MERRKLDSHFCLLDTLTNTSSLKRVLVLVHACVNGATRASISNRFVLQNSFFILLILISISVTGQQSVVVGWPLTVNDASKYPATVSSANFSSGLGLKSLNFNSENGATTTGWNSQDLDETDYYEFKVTPAKYINLRFSKLSFEVDLDQVNMRTEIYYSLDDFTTSNNKIGQSVYVGLNSVSTLNVVSNIVVNYPQTLSIRIYGWSALSEDVKFSIKNVLFTGAIIENTRAVDGFTVSGGGLVCANSSTTIYLSGSDDGVDYELFIGNTLSKIQSGDGGPLEFTGITNPGIYSIWADGNFIGEVLVYNDTEKPLLIKAISGAEGVAPDGIKYTHPDNSWDVVLQDNCGIASIKYNLTGKTTGEVYTLKDVTFNLGITTVTWTATDLAGNSITGSFEIKVTKEVKPLTITCVDNKVVPVTNGCVYQHSGTTWDPSVTNNNGPVTLSFTLSGSTSGTFSSLDGVGFNVGITTVEINAVDQAGNTATCSFIVNVTESVKPVISFANQVLNIPSGCSYTVTDASWDATATDNCTAAPSLTYTLAGSTNGNGTSLQGVTFNLGTTIINWKATDASGNIDEKSMEVTIKENKLPEITLALSGLIFVETNTGCTYIHPGTSWDATATDECGIKTFGYTLTGVTTGSGITLENVTFNLGLTTVTWTAIDHSGNIVTKSFDVTVFDNIKPSITCITTDEIKVKTNSGCTYLHAGIDWDATITDNCQTDGVVYSLSGVTGGTGASLNNVEFAVGTTIVTWTGKDKSGNIQTCTFKVTVKDEEQPVIVNPFIPAFYSNDLGKCGALVNPKATVTDNCGIASELYYIGLTQINLPYEFPIGSTTVTVIAKDNNGNESKSDFTVTVLDNELPVIKCPTLLASYPNDAGSCFAKRTFSATATDNCGTPRVEYSINGDIITFPYQFPIGSTIVTSIAYDKSNNESVPCSFIVTIEDKEPPTITCPISDASYNNDLGQSSASLTFTATASDACDLTPTIRYEVNGSIITFPYNFPIGSTSVTAVAKDNTGNESPCYFTVIVKDTEGPVITAPNNVVQSLGASCTNNINVEYPVIKENSSNFKLTWTMTGSTIAASPATGINYVPRPYPFSPGVTTITYNIQDAAGNVDDCTFTVTVNDLEAPVFDYYPETITFELPAGQCSMLVNYPLPTATDCSNFTLTRTAGPASGTSFPAGVTTITYTATDNASNSKSFSFKINVKDVTPPEITCPPAKLLEINTNCNVTLPYNEVGIATVTDDCTSSSAIIIKNDYPTNGIFPVGHNYITWSATDASGNTSTCKQLVSVTRGIALVNYSYSNYTIYPKLVSGILQPEYTAPGVISSQSFPSGLTTYITSLGVIPGPAAFVQSGKDKPGLFTDFKGAAGSEQYYQFEISGLGTSYSAFYLYFQFYRDNKSDGEAIEVYYSTNGTKYTWSLTRDISNYDPKKWYEIYQSLKGIPELNNSPKVYIRIYFKNRNGNPKLSFDNFQYSAFNEDIAAGTATATDVDCPRDLNGTITIDNTSTGIWEYTIDGGKTWQASNIFTGLGIGMYDVRMRMPGTYSCDVVINVALPIKSRDITPPVITCEPAKKYAATNVENTAATITLTNPIATDACTLPANMLVSWVATGATSFSGTGAIGTQVFPIGTTYIQYTVKDEAANASTCTVPVTVLARPQITCPSDMLSWVTNPGTNTHIGSPDAPTITGGTNVILSWEMTGATKASGTSAIINYPFNVGTTTITWTAKNDVDLVTCTQTIIVTDNEAPTFITPDSYNLCVEEIYNAVYEESNSDILPYRPEYYQFHPGNNAFDLDLTSFKDNYCTLTSSDLTWRINTYGTSPSVYSGTGQPSMYSSIIKLPGDGLTFKDIKHTITYTLTDCNNNKKEVIVPITIKPRPNIVKML